MALCGTSLPEICCDGHDRRPSRSEPNSHPEVPGTEGWDLRVAWMMPCPVRVHDPGLGLIPIYLSTASWSPDFTPGNGWARV